MIDLNQHALFAELSDNTNTRVHMAKYTSIFSVLGTLPLLYIQLVYMQERKNLHDNHHQHNFSESTTLLDNSKSNSIFNSHSHQDFISSTNKNLEQQFTPKKFLLICFLLSVFCLLGYYYNCKKLTQIVKEKYQNLPRRSSLYETHSNLNLNPNPNEESQSRHKNRSRNNSQNQQNLKFINRSSGVDINPSQENQAYQPKNELTERLISKDSLDTDYDDEHRIEMLEEKIHNKDVKTRCSKIFSKFQTLKRSKKLTQNYLKELLERSIDF